MQNAFTIHNKCESVSFAVMKIQISDVMKSALHARCGERYIIKERGEIDIYVSLLQIEVMLHLKLKCLILAAYWEIIHLSDLIRQRMYTF